MSKILRKFALLPLLAWAAMGCATDDVGEDDPLSGSDEELIRKTGPTSHWSYHGLLPELESPRLTVSLKGHTVHVEGLLPRSFDRRLPFHVKTEEVAGGRTKVHVVYPIATVDPTGHTPEGLRTRNPEPFVYKVCGGDNFHASNSIGAFGGFPFIQYVCNHRDKDGRLRDGIAFHGPITSKNADGTTYWSLLRGPVSHACNRMLGEHVLELAHIIGFDDGDRNVPTEVIAGFDTFNGKKIDVNYPATGWTRPDREESVVFPIWQAVRQRGDGSVAIDFPRWACETSRCSSMPANGRDPFTGQ
jgi:hypothetical protein